MASRTSTSLRLGSHSVSDAATQDALFTITRAATHFPSIILKKMLFTVSHTGTNKLLGTIRYHKPSRPSTYKSKTVRPVFHKQTSKKAGSTFQPTVLSSRVESWLWSPDSKDSSNHTAVLVDANDEKRILAQKVLSFEADALSDEMRNDNIVTAVALCESASKHTGLTDVDLGNWLHARDRLQDHSGRSAGKTMGGGGHLRGSAAAVARASGGGGGGGGC